MAIKSRAKDPEAPATLVLGPDVLVESVIDELGGPRDSIQSLRPGEEGLLKAIDLLAQPSMFAASENTVWIRGLRNEPASEVEALLDFLDAGIPAGARLFATAPRLDKRSRLYKFFEKRARILDLRPDLESNGRLRRADVERLVRERVKNAGAEPFAKPAIDEICRRSGGDVAQLFQETDKLILCQRPQRPVGAELVREVMVDQAGAWVFDLTDALGERVLERALSVVSRLLDAGEAPLRLTATLATRVAVLLEAARACELFGPSWKGLSYAAFIAGPYKRLPDSARTRFPPNYHTYRVFRDAAAFESTELRSLHAGLLVLDRSLKRSAVSPEAGLSHLLAGACVQL